MSPVISELILTPRCKIIRGDRMHIAPKSGRLATGAYERHSPISGSPFGEKSIKAVRPAFVGGVSMLDNRQATTFGNPLSDNFDTATMKSLPPTTSFQNRSIDTLGVVPEISPTERGKFFRKTPLVSESTIQKTQFGATAEKESDTAFHPKPKVVDKRKPLKSSIAGERTNAASFTSHAHLWGDPNNSFLRGVSQATSGIVGDGRWNTTKRSVV